MLCMWTQEHFNKIPNVALAHIESALEFGHGERILTNVIEDLIAGNKQIWLGTLETEFVATVEHPCSSPSQISLRYVISLSRRKLLRKSRM